MASHRAWVHAFWRKWDVELVSALLLAFAFTALALQAGCDSDSDGDYLEPPWPTWGVAGTVYVCDSGAACIGSEEWCWAGDVADLEALLGAKCHAIGINERLWPALTGCRHACPPEGKGCNAHCGCFCEAP